MTESEAYDVTDIWKLSLLSRWRLYQFWISEAKKARKYEIFTSESKYCHLKKLLKEHNAFVNLEVLKGAMIVGMTTSGAAKYQSETVLQL